MSSLQGRATARRFHPVVGQLSFLALLDSLPRMPVAAAPEPRTEKMRDVLRVLRRAARAGLPAPTNPIIAIQTESVRQTPARIVHILVEEGFFRMEVRDQKRRFHFPDGASTDWGDFRDGHPPGPRRTEPRKAVRAPNSPPRAPAVKAIPVDVRRPPDLCQFPTWGDDERPPADADGRVCGIGALHGESWCMAHLSVVSPKRAARRAALLASTSLSCSAVLGKT
jgi:hypothetical protein